MKIGHLFRCFFPTDAKKFEVTKEFFSLPIESLKSKIVSLVPEMDIIFTRYLDKMSLYQIFPGKYRFKINGLKEDLKELGAYGLSSAIFGENLTERVISILKMGMIAAEIRDAHNLNSPGLSSEIDKWSGGSDSVFTQMITESTQSYDNLAYQSNIRILFDLEVIETGTYQYSIDILGLRRRDYYGAYDLSLGIFDFTDSIQQEHTISYMGHEIIIEDSYAHELMVKERISPNWIKGLVVKNELIKKELVQALNQANMLKKDELGRDTILGILLDSFIHIGSEVKKEQFFI